jgi:outer membrane lipoprotein-sorting protein
MKKLALIFSLALVMTGMQVQAQSLKKVLKKHYAATGQNDLAKVETVTMSGKIVQMGLEIPFNTYMKRPGMMRTEGTFQGMTFLQTYNGSEGWSVNPFAGSMEAVPMGPVELKAMSMQSDIDGMLYTYKNKGYKAELKGTETVDGADCHKIEIITSDNDIYNFFINKETQMCIKVGAAVMMEGVVNETESYMFNFMTVDGISFPGVIETRYGGQTAMTMVFENIKLNTEMDAAFFGKPQ